MRCLIRLEMTDPDGFKNARPVGRPRTVDDQTRRERNRLDQQRFREKNSQDKDEFQQHMLRMMSAFVEANHTTQAAIRKSMNDTRPLLRVRQFAIE